MEFAEVRAYEHGDDFRAIDWNVSARLGEPLREDVHRGAGADPDAGGGPVGVDPVRRADDQGGARGRGRGGPGAGGGVPQRPGGRAALLRRGGAGDPAAERPPPRAPGHPRPGRLRARGTPDQSGRQPVLRQPAAASPEYRGGALRLHRRRLGAAAPPARGPPRGRGDHRGRSAGARPARRRLDRDAGCRVGPARAGGYREPRRAHPGEPSWPSGAGRSGRGSSPRSERTRWRWRPAREYALPLRRAFARRARRIHRG